MKFIKVINNFGTIHVNVDVIADVHPDRKCVTSTIPWQGVAYIYEEVENMDEILVELGINKPIKDGCHYCGSDSIMIITHADGRREEVCVSCDKRNAWL